MGDPASVEDAFKGESGCDDVFPVERSSGISAPRARPNTCEVIGCARDATWVYLDASAGWLLDFGLCADHFFRIDVGARPLVVGERFDLAQLGGPPALLLVEQGRSPRVVEVCGAQDEECLEVKPAAGTLWYLPVGQFRHAA